MYQYRDDKAIFKSSTTALDILCCEIKNLEGGKDLSLKSKGNRELNIAG
jgi:hypothetical protein